MMIRSKAGEGGPSEVLIDSSSGVTFWPQIYPYFLRLSTCFIPITKEMGANLHVDCTLPFRWNILLDIEAEIVDQNSVWVICDHNLYGELSI